MGFFDRDKKASEEVEVQDTLQDEEQVEVQEEKKVRKPFALWEVKDRTFRLKLTTAGIIELEKKYKTNLMNIMGAGQGGMPSLTVMLDVAHVAMKQFEHGIKANDVLEIFEKYLEDGGSQLSFYTGVYMEIFTVSGFFSASLTDQMQDTLEEVKEIL